MADYRNVSEMPSPEEGKQSGSKGVVSDNRSSSGEDSSNYKLHYPSSDAYVKISSASVELDDSDDNQDALNISISEDDEDETMENGHKRIQSANSTVISDYTEIKSIASEPPPLPPPPQQQQQQYYHHHPNPISQLPKTSPPLPNKTPPIKGTHRPPTDPHHHSTSSNTQSSQRKKKLSTPSPTHPKSSSSRTPKSCPPNNKNPPPKNPKTTTTRPGLSRSSSAPGPLRSTEPIKPPAHHLRHQNTALESLLNSETFAFPARKRSISTHSGEGGGARGVDGLIEDLAKQDAEMEESKRSRRERRQLRKKQQKMSKESLQLEREREARNESEKVHNMKLASSSQQEVFESNYDLDGDENAAPLGFAMERFLSSTPHVEEKGQNDADGGAVRRTVAVMEAIRSTSPTTAPAGVIINTADPTLAEVVRGDMVTPCGSSATSSLLSDLMVRDQDLDVDLEGIEKEKEDVAKDILQQNSKGGGISADEDEEEEEEEDRQVMRDLEASLSDGSMFDDVVPSNRVPPRNTSTDALPDHASPIEELRPPQPPPYRVLRDHSNPTRNPPQPPPPPPPPQPRMITQNDIDFMTSTPNTLPRLPTPEQQIHYATDIDCAPPPHPTSFFREDQLAASYTSSSQPRHYSEDTTFLTVSSAGRSARSVLEGDRIKDLLVAGINGRPPPHHPPADASNRSVQPPIESAFSVPGAVPYPSRQPQPYQQPPPPQQPYQQPPPPQPAYYERDARTYSIGSQRSRQRSDSVGDPNPRKSSVASTSNRSQQGNRPPADSVRSASSANKPGGGMVNRRIRPGKTPLIAKKKKTSKDSSTQRSQLSGSMQSAKSPLVVDGFDYDKYDHAPRTPRQQQQVGQERMPYNTPPGMVISPIQPPPLPPEASKRGYMQGGGMMMNNPPLPPGNGTDPNPNKHVTYPLDPRFYSPRQQQQEMAMRTQANPQQQQQQQQQTDAFYYNYGSAAPPPNPNYPRVDQRNQRNPMMNHPHDHHLEMNPAPMMNSSYHYQHQSNIPEAEMDEFTDEQYPLVPREVSTIDNRRRSSRRSEMVVESVFSSVRSVSTEDIEADMNDSDLYLANGMFSRAFPERFFALLVTLAVEVPVLLMISGGSERLCELIGRRRYQLTMAFLPLASAISGNCGLQGSTLTTRAISHGHLQKNNFLSWLRRELGASFCLGCSMGTVLGLFAYQASGNDWSFGLTIAVAQFISIWVAGLTGTVAPLLFTFIFHRDAGKWGGPLETAIQDIVGSFAMVVLSYRLLVVLGPTEIEPGDSCVAGGLD